MASSDSDSVILACGLALVSSVAIQKQKLNLRAQKQAQSEYRHSLTFRIRRYIAVATKPVHRLQIRETVHNKPQHENIMVCPIP